jgi:hypothetical protein
MNNLAASAEVMAGAPGKGGPAKKSGINPRILIRGEEYPDHRLVAAAQ